MTSEAPTVRGIMAVLADAGFTRGVSRPEAQAAGGYAVIPNRPDDGIVLVNWWGPDAEHAEMLSRYTEAIKAAGYRVRRSDGGYFLVVTAKTETTEEG